MNARPRKNSTSQYKGVYWSSYHQKWAAHIHVSGRKVYIGRYATQREAALAYNDAAEEHFGEYARLNEIIDDPNDTPVAEPRPPKTASYRGVCWDSQRSMWMAKIQVNKRTVNLGRFTDELEAAIAYDSAARIYHGSKAKLNFSYARCNRTAYIAPTFQKSSES
jgi:AP2-like factor (euAP2 lineage)